MFREAPWLQLHRELGLSPAPEPDDRAFAEHVALRAAERPDAVALQFHDLGMNYAELDRLGSQFANLLKSEGVTKGDVVGIHLPNLPQYVVALVGLSRIGAVGSGVSPLLTPPEFRHQIADAGVKVLLTMDAFAAGTLRRVDGLPSCLRTVIVTGAGDHLGATPAEPLALEGPRCLGYLDSLRGMSGDCAQTPVYWNDDFMIQYTGGTTGKPKGAVLSLRNIMYNPQQLAPHAPWQPYQDVLITGFPMFHIAGLAFHLAGVRFGARTLLVPDPRDVGHMCRQMKRFPPTRIGAVPTLFQMLLNTPEFYEIDFSQLQFVGTGAAPITGEDRSRIEAVIGRNRLADTFGMTETGPAHLCNPLYHCKPTAVGIPVAGADTRIVDVETGTREMPFGEPGEIITSGPQVMKGYLNLPEETANALRVLDGRTWMFTGDVGYMDEEGYVYLCDRAKDMLIVGGYKVFSVEVEDKLKGLAFIAQSALIGTPDEARPGNDVVNLYVELTPDARGRDEEELRAEITAFCRSNLAPYKVPKKIVFVAQVPLTPVGKIDKKALRVLARA